MAWIAFVKTIAQNVRNWLEKLKCQFTCCNSYVSVRVAGSSPFSASLHGIRRERS